MRVSFLDFLFPRRSLSGEEGEWITESERSQLRPRPFIEMGEILRRQGIRHLDRLVAGSHYRASPLLRRAIHTLKYRRIPGLRDDLAALMMAGSRTISFDDAVLCPVPLHWSRRFWRGFNQAELLASVLARECHLPMRALLRRVRPTGFQSHRTREERLRAVSGAFWCEARPPKRIILIDDIATTGATLDACAEALKTAGAIWVEGWVVARG